MKKEYWDEKEWESLLEILERLSFKELSEIAKLSGINFSEGISNLRDNENLTAKEQIILVLEECEKEELKKAIREVTNNTSK